jgi:hypothetical protein
MDKFSVTSYVTHSPFIQWIEIQPTYFQIIVHITKITISAAL